MLQGNAYFYDGQASGQLEGGINTYGYVGGNPISFVDPDGLLCTYEIGTRQLRCTNDRTGEVYLNCNGYAGTGVGRNNADAQNVPNVGPLPEGDYSIGSSFTHGHAGRGTRRLTPAPTNEMYGRSGFLIHGDNARNDASNGCIVTTRNCRDSIPAGELLRVEP